MMSMKKYIWPLLLTSLALVSCGGGSKDEVPFSPGRYEGSLTVALSETTLKKSRNTCRTLTGVFLSDGEYRLIIRENGDMLDVFHETSTEMRQVARIDRHQTAFGTEERIEFSSMLFGSGNASCAFTFNGHFTSKESGIEEGGTIDGNCEGSKESLDCTFSQEMGLTPE